MRSRNVKAVCDVCGWKFKLRDLRKNSYGLLVCPTDYEGIYDSRSHPQNRAARFKAAYTVKDARPDFNTSGVKNWEDYNINWEDLNQYWNSL